MRHRKGLPPMPNKSDVTASPGIPAAEKPLQGSSAALPPLADHANSNGPTRALQGDDYALEYYADGYPVLPACLDRRPKPKIAEAA